MRKHIFVSAFIFLTVGCQPTTDGSLLSHSGTDFTERGFQKNHESDVKQLSGSDSDVLNLQRSLGNKTSTPDIEAQLAGEVNAAFYDAVIRLQMDLAGTSEETLETKLLTQLLASKNGPSGAPIMQSLKLGRLSIDTGTWDLSPTAGESLKVTSIAKAFKQVSALYGFSVEDQKTVEQVILKKSAMLAPLESQKSMAEANGALLQAKLNEAVIALGKKELVCSSLQLLKNAAENFYAQDAQYVLPALIQRKGKIVSGFIAKAFNLCTQRGGTTKVVESLTSASEAITFDLGSLELYLTPKNTFNWQEFQNFRVQFYLKESRVSSALTLADVSCKLNGQELVLREPQINAEREEAAFDLPVNGSFPLVVSKAEMQKGVTLSFTADNSRVTQFNAMTLTKIKPNILVPAVHFVAGDKTIAEFRFLPAEKSQESSVICELKNKTE